MSEQAGDREWQEIVANQAKAEEYRQLNEKQRVLREQIETGTETDAAHLDKFLEASATFYQWKTHHPASHHSANQREEDGVQFLRYQKLRRGTYQGEKTGFCLEMAQEKKEVADHEEKLLQEGHASIDREESTEIIGRARTFAANWLRTTANCLEMPTARPAPPPQENGQK
jgi:hypothetical protein